jgi:hypothetical protein
VPFEKVQELHVGWLLVIVTDTFTLESSEIGHSVTTDLLDEFRPTDDVRDAVAALYLGGVLSIRDELF